MKKGSVCSRKGNHKYGHMKNSGCCECMAPFVSGIDKDPRYAKSIFYAMRTSPCQNGIEILPVHPDKIPEGFILVSPCQKFFLSETSEGTKMYLGSCGKSSTFRGCEPLEDELKALGLIRYRTRETVGLPFEEASKDGVDDQHFLEEGAKSVDGIFRLLRGLFSQGKDYAPSPEETTEHGESIEMISLNQLALNEATYRKRLAGLTTTILKELTDKQSDALRAVYLHNIDHKPKTEIAKMLGIRVDTLQERLDLAFKRIRAKFPEYQDRRQSSLFRDKEKKPATVTRLKRKKVSSTAPLQDFSGDGNNRSA